MEIHITFYINRETPSASPGIVGTFGLRFTTRVYNLISVPEFTQLLSGDAIILSKQTRVALARRRRIAMVQLEIIKQC